MSRVFAVVVAIGCAMSSRIAVGELVVSTDFENASAVVDGIDQASGTIRIHPAGDPQRGWPCWWAFRVDGVEPGRTIRFEIDRTTGLLPADTGAGSEGKPLNPIWSHPDRAAFSLDGGRTWQQTELGRTVDGRRRYAQQVDAPSVLFAWGPMFTPADGAALVRRAVERQPQSTAFELAQTRAGRTVAAVAVRAGPKPDVERDVVWIQARQHAWESGGSWVGRGLLEWWIGDDPRAGAVREQALLYFVPIMDVDSVATGNGGKGQYPQDHNRDWSDAPHFPEVAAAQREIQELDRRGRFAIFIDLHNPGQSEKQPYFFTSPPELLSDAGSKNLDLFLAEARREIVGPLRLLAESKPSGAGYSTKWREISKNWVTAHTQPGTVALTLETAWNTPHSTPRGYTTVGRQLGRAIEGYLRTRARRD